MGSELDDQLKQDSHAARIRGEREQMRETGFTREEIRAGVKTPEQVIRDLERRIVKLEADLAKKIDKGKLHGKEPIKVSGSLITIDVDSIPGQRRANSEVFFRPVNLIDSGGIIRVVNIGTDTELTDAEPDDAD